MLLGSAVAQNRVPPPIEAQNCSAGSPSAELPNARFQRKGGRTTASKVLFEQGVLTVQDVAQGRNLSRYEQPILVNARPKTVVERKHDPTLPRARDSLWQHWPDHKQAYLILTLSRVDATSTSHVFVEQDDSGRWRVSWRIVRHRGEVDELPTYHAVEWVVPAEFRRPGKPLEEGQQPDPIKNILEFRDRCGDVDQSL